MKKFLNYLTDHKMDMILFIIGLLTLGMIIWQSFLYILTGSYMESLSHDWFQYTLGECGVLGVIKSVKLVMAEKEKKDEKKNKDLELIAKQEEAMKNELNSERESQMETVATRSGRVS